MNFTVDLECGEGVHHDVMMHKTWIAGLRAQLGVTVGLDKDEM